MSCDWAPTGREFVSGSYDRTVRMWTGGEGKTRDTYHTKRMQRSVPFLPPPSLAAHGPLAASSPLSTPSTRASSSQDPTTRTSGSGKLARRRSSVRSISARWRARSTAMGCARSGARSPKWPSSNGASFSATFLPCSTDGCGATGNASFPSRFTTPRRCAGRCSMRGRKRRRTGGRMRPRESMRSTSSPSPRGSWRSSASRVSAVEGSWGL